MRSAAKNAIARVGECGAQMAASAQSLRKAWPGVRMEQSVRNSTLALCAQLSEVASEVAAGLPSAPPKARTP